MARTIFVNLPVADVAASTAFFAALGFERDGRFSNEQASAMVAAALAAGGSEPRAVHDLGFMYSRAFADLDGHMFEPMYMDLAAAEATFAAVEAA